MFKELFAQLPEGAFWPTGKWFKEVLGAALDGDRVRLAPTSGSEIPLANGRFFVVAPGTTNSGLFPVPFTVLVKSINNVLCWAVVNNSSVQDDPTSTDGGTDVTGCLGDNPPQDSDTAWQAIAENDCIWLEVQFGTYPAINAYVINSLGAGGSFGGGRCEYAGASTPVVYAQTYGRVILAVATTAAGSGGGPRTLTSFQQMAIGTPVLLESVEHASLSSGGTPKYIPAMMPFF